jgi:hypothetical protein
MMKARRQQPHFGEGLIAEQISDRRAEWRTHAEPVLEDEPLVSTVARGLLLAIHWRFSHSMRRMC